MLAPTNRRRDTTCGLCGTTDTLCELLLPATSREARRDREIDQHERPEVQVVGSHVGYARAHLIDTNETTETG